MIKRKRESKNSLKEEKDLWHRLDLQKLRDDKFIHVANQILQGRFAMINLNAPTILRGE